MESILLVPVDIIKQKSYVNANVEDDVIATSIVRFQEVVLMPILGRKFYKHLIDAFKNTTLTAEEITLIQDYISKCIIAGVEYRIMPRVKTEIRNSGMQQEPMQADRRDVVDLRTESLKDANFYENELQIYVCENKAKFPDHGGKCVCSCGTKTGGNLNNFFII